LDNHCSRDQHRCRANPNPPPAHGFGAGRRHDKHFRFRRVAQRPLRHREISTAKFLPCLTDNFRDDTFEFLRIRHPAGFQCRQGSQIIFAAVRHDRSVITQRKVRTILADRRHDHAGHACPEPVFHRRQPQHQSVGLPAEVKDEKTRAKKARKCQQRPAVETLWLGLAVGFIGKFQHSVCGAKEQTVVHTGRTKFKDPKGKQGSYEQGQKHQAERNPAQRLS